MHVRFKYIVILLLLFSSRIYSGQAQGKLSESEYNKLISFVVHTINRDEIRDRVFTKASNLMMLGFHLNENKKIDSVSFQCSDSVVAIAMRKMSYDQLLVHWDFLIPDTNAKTLMGKQVTFYLPIVIINDSERSNESIFSKKDIEAIFLKDSFNNAIAYALSHTILLKPADIGVSTHPGVR